MRIVGMDIHRVAAEVVSLYEGNFKKLGRIPMMREALEDFARRELTHDDHVVIEATGNAVSCCAVAGALGRARGDCQSKASADDRTCQNQDRCDRRSHLAKLYATGFLPEVWMPDMKTLALRRQVARRTQFVRQRVRLKNLIQSILHSHLIPPCAHGNLTGISGRKWLTRQRLPPDERQAVDRHLTQIDQIEQSLKIVEADIAQHAVQDPTIHRLMTLPGVDVTVAVGSSNR